MAAIYDIVLCDDRGRRLMPLNNLANFSASRIVNGVGGFSAALKAATDLPTLQKYHYIERTIRPDWQVQVWRKARGPMKLWRSYFLLGWSWAQDEGGDEVFSISGYDVNHLLTRRVVAAYSENAQATMTDYADDMLKAIVTDSLQDDAAPVPTAGTRAWGDLSVDNDVSKGPSLTMSFAWERLLTLSGGGVLPKICAASHEQGTDLFFGVAVAEISGTRARYRFRTATGQPGRNLTAGRNRVIFDAEAGALENWALTYDYSEEQNYIYTLGQGTKTDRAVEQIYDAARYGRSYWGRCEGVAEARMAKTAAERQSVGYAALSENRPRVALRGTPVSRAGQEFGRHYDVGDRVIAKAKGQQFEAIVMGAVVSLDEDGRVSEQARLEFYE